MPLGGAFRGVLATLQSHSFPPASFSVLLQMDFYADASDESSTWTGPLKEFITDVKTLILTPLHDRVTTFR